MTARPSIMFICFGPVWMLGPSIQTKINRKWFVMTRRLKWRPASGVWNRTLASMPWLCDVDISHAQTHRGRSRIPLALSARSDCSHFFTAKLHSILKVLYIDWKEIYLATLCKNQIYCIFISLFLNNFYVRTCVKILHLCQLQLDFIPLYFTNIAFLTTGRHSTLS